LLLGNFPFMELPDFSTSWNETKSAPCDRRLSRAAREFLRRHLLHTAFWDLKHVQRDVEPFRYENSNETVHTLLERWLAKMPSLASDETTKSECLLHPHKQDLYRDDDAQTQHIHVQSLPGGLRKNLKIAYPQSVLKHGRTSDETKHASLHWFQCAFCGKIFITQFYLDVHLTTHHPHNDQASGMVCPAIEWCKLVGMANCHHQALQDEPLYDRGIGSGSDAFTAMIQHKWSKISHSVPCSVQQLHEDCESILSSCGLLEHFEDNHHHLAPTLQHTNMTEVSFCRTLSCPPQQTLWNFFEEEAHGYLLGFTWTTSILSLASFRAQWEAIWRAETEHQSILFSWRGITVLVFLLLWILTKAFVAPPLRVSSARTTIPSGQRLLYKRGSHYRAIAPRNSATKKRTRIKCD
jgi:hypothetical protein